MGKITASLKAITFMVGTVIGLNTINYHITRGEIVEQRVDGHRVYTHSDPLTTHYLNYLTGVEAITREERRDMFRKGVENFCIGYAIQDCPDTSSMTERDIVKYVIEKSQDYSVTIEEGLSELDELIPLQRDFNPYRYNVLWQIVKEAGGPKVRWTMDRDHEDQISTKTRMHNSRYNSLSHTVHFGIQEPLSLITAELAHAIQSHQYPITNRVMHFEMIGRVAREVIAGKTIARAYDSEYTTPGTYEYEAHQIIEPTLRARLGIKEGE